MIHNWQAQDSGNSSSAAPLGAGSPPTAGAAAAAAAAAANSAKYRCPSCGLEFAKWSICLRHLREAGHSPAGASVDVGSGNLKRAQVMCAIRFRQSSPTDAPTGSLAPDAAVPVATFQGTRAPPPGLAFPAAAAAAAATTSALVLQPPPAPLLVVDPRNPFRGLPDRVAYTINQFLTFDELYDLFRANEKGQSTDSSRVRTWSANLTDESGDFGEIDDLVLGEED